MWNCLIEYYQNDQRLRESIFELEVHNYHLSQDVIVLQIQMKNSTSYLSLIWKNSCMQREICSLRSKLCQLENELCRKVEELLHLKKEIEIKNGLLNSIVEIIASVNQTSKSTSSDNIILNLKEKMGELLQLREEVNEKNDILKIIIEIVNESTGKSIKAEIDLIPHLKEKMAELLQLRKEVVEKNQFLNLIIEIVDDSNGKSIKLEMKDLIPTLEQKILLLNDLTRRLSEQDKLLSELRKQIDDYLYLDQYIFKVANSDYDFSILNLSLENVLTIHPDSDGKTTHANSLKNICADMKCSSSIVSLKAITDHIERSLIVIQELRKKLSECKCSEYAKEIEQLQGENANLKKIGEAGILSRETFIKLYDELSVDMVETKTYLQYLQDILKNDTYTADLESKNYTLASTILEMEKYIERLKSELADASNKSNQSFAIAINTRVDELETILKKKDSELNKLSDVLSIKELMLSKMESKNKELSQNIVSDHDQLNKTNEKIDVYEKLVDKTLSEMGHCKQTFESMHEKIQWLQENLSRKFSEMNTMESHTQTQAETIAMLRKQLSEEKQKYYEDVEKLSSTVKKLENKMMNEKSKNKSLENGLLMIKKELENRQNREHELIQTLNQNEKCIENLENNLQCMRKSNKKVPDENLIEEIAILKETMHEMENVITKLNFEQENFDKKYTALLEDFEGSSKLNMEKDVQLYELSNQLKNLQSEHEVEIEKCKRHLEKDEKMIEDLNAMLKSKRDNHHTKIEELKERLAKKENETKNLMADHASALHQMEAQYYNMLTQFERNVSEKDQIIDNLKDLLKCSGTTQKKFSEENTKLQKIIEEKNQLIYELNTSNDKYLAEKGELFGKEISKYQEELKENEQGIKIIKEVVTNQNRKIDELNAENVSLKQELIKRQLTLDKVTNKYKDVISELKRNFELIESKSHNEINDLDQIVKSFRDNVREKEKLLKSTNQELFLLRVQLNERGAIIEEQKRVQIELRNELDSALNEIIKYEEKIYRKDRLIENLQRSLAENVESFKYSKEVAEVWKLVTEKDNVIKQMIFEHEKLVKSLENDYLEKIQRYKLMNNEYEIKLQSYLETSNVHSRQIDELEFDKRELHAQLQKKEKIIQNLLRNNKMFFENISNKHVKEIDRLHKINLHNENLIKEIQTMKNLSDTYYQSTHDELHVLKMNLDEKDKIIEQLIVSHYHADNELINQCQFVVNQCKYQITENEKCINNLRKNLAYKDQQLANEGAEKQKLCNELQAKNAIIGKFVGSTEDHCKNIENEWMLKFKNLQLINYEQERKINHLESIIKSHLTKINSLQNQNVDLQKEMKCYQNSMQALKNTFEADLSSLNNQRKKELHDYNKRLVQKEKELQENKLHYDQLLKKFNNLSWSCECLQRSATGTDEKSYKTESKIILMENNMKKIQEENAFLKHRNSHLKIELVRVRNINELLNAEVDQFKSHIQYQEMVIKELESQEQKYLSFVDDSSHLHNEQEFREFQMLLHENTTHYRESIEKLSKVKYKILEKDAEIQKMQAEHELERDESIESFLNAMASLESSIKLKDNEMHSMDAIMKHAELEISRLNLEIKALIEAKEQCNKRNIETVTELENRIEKEVNSYKNELCKKNKQIQELQDTINTSQHEHSKLREENEELRNKLIEKEQTLQSCAIDLRSIRDLTSQNENEVKYYRHQVMERDEMIKQLTRTISEYKNSFTDVNYLRKEVLEKTQIIRELEEELQLRSSQTIDEPDHTQICELQFKLKECRKKLIDSNKENFCINRRLNNEISVQNKFKSKYDNEVKRNRRHEMMIINLNKQLVNKNNVIKSFEQFKLQTEPKIRQLTETLRRLSCEIKEKESMINHINESFQNDYQKIINDFNENIRKVDTFDDRFFSRYISIIQDYNHKIYELERKNEVLAKANVDIKGQFNRFSCEINTLKQQITDKDKYLELLQKNHENVVQVLHGNLDREKQKSTEELEISLNEKLTKIDKLLLEINEKNESICNQTKMNDEKLIEIDRLKNIIEDDKKIIDKLSIALNESNGRNEHGIQNRIEYESNNFDQIMDMKRKNCDLRSTINELSVKIESFKSNNKNLKKKMLENEKCFKIQHEKVVRDNEKLRNHLTKFINNYGKSDTQTEQTSATSSEQLEVCLKIISELRNEKTVLESDNIALTEEVTRLNAELYERNQENMTKQQRIECMEKENMELDRSRNELRAESKQVLENVRCWIQEQRQINSALNDNMKQKCAALERFKKERLNLLNDIDMLKQTNRQLVSENHLLKQKLYGQSSQYMTPDVFESNLGKNFDSSFGSNQLDTTSNSASLSNSGPNNSGYIKSHCRDPKCMP